jgi:zinc transport system permease protein
MLEFAFMQRAFVASVAIGLVCGVLGFFVVLRRLAFIGVGISHSAIGGIAIGILAGLNPLLTASVFAVAVALGIAAISRRGLLAEDTVIGVFFSGSMALGIVLISMNPGYQGDLFGYLFGNVLAVSQTELWALLGGGLLVLALLLLSFRQQIFIAFDAELAEAYGQPVTAMNNLLLVLLALTVILGVRLAGVLLIEALLVVPAATAVLWASNYRGQLLLSGFLGAGCGAVGLAAAYQLDVAPGGAIILLAVALFFVSVLLRQRRG